MTEKEETQKTERALDEYQRHEVSEEVYDRLLAEIEEPGQIVDAIVQILQKPRRIKLPSIED